MGILLAGLVVASPASHAVAAVESTKVTQTFRFDATGAVSSQPLVARKRRPLLVADIRGADVVTVDTPIEVTVVNGAKISSRRLIAAGEVLQGWPGKPGVYCAPARESPLYITAACLQDADGDGRFESSLTAAFTDRTVETYNIGHKGGLVAVTHEAPTALAAPLAYRKADPGAGPAARVKLMWTVVGTLKPGDPVTVGLYLEVGSVTRASFAFSEGQRYTLAGGVGDINFHGLVIHVLGFDPDGSIRYTSEGGTGGEPIDIFFMFMRPPTVIYIPVYVG